MYMDIWVYIPLRYKFTGVYTIYLSGTIIRVYIPLRYNMGVYTSQVQVYFLVYILRYMKTSAFSPQVKLYGIYPLMFRYMGLYLYLLETGTRAYKPLSYRFIY